jgi:hypothetical protein
MICSSKAASLPSGRRSFFDRQLVAENLFKRLLRNVFFRRLTCIGEGPTKKNLSGRFTLDDLEAVCWEREASFLFKSVTPANDGQVIFLTPFPDIGFDTLPDSAIQIRGLWKGVIDRRTDRATESFCRSARALGGTAKRVATWRERIGRVAGDGPFRALLRCRCRGAPASQAGDGQNKNKTWLIKPSSGQCLLIWFV